VYGEALDPGLAVGSSFAFSTRPKTPRYGLVPRDEERERLRRHLGRIGIELSRPKCAYDPGEAWPNEPMRSAIGPRSSSVCQRPARSMNSKMPQLHGSRVVESTLSIISI
jgi:hypothetical protein